MLRSLSTRSPLFLRVFLTGMSALAGILFASAFSYAHAAMPSVAVHRDATATGHSAAPRAAADNKVTVQGGETLSGLSAGICGTPEDWTGFFAANRSVLRSPDLIFPGQMLQINCSDPGYTPPAPPPAPPVQHHVTVADAAVSNPVPQRAQTPPSTPAQSYSGQNGTFQACVIARESGGNSQVMNASGHYGLYQFSYSTWTAHGGSGADFGHASVAEQNQVFANTVAQDGHSDWSPYDGC